MTLEADFVFRHRRRGVRRTAIRVGWRKTSGAVDDRYAAHAAHCIRRIRGSVDARTPFSFSDMRIMTIDTLGMPVVGGSRAECGAAVFACAVNSRRRNRMLVGFVELRFYV